MSDINDVVSRYIDVWNTDDPTARRARIDRLWTEDASYIDPLVVAEGRAAIDAAVGAARAGFPGLTFRLAGPVDAHHDVARFTWELGPAGGEALVVGFDVAVLRDGHLRAVYGFLDKVPAA
jgi:hypothetical protein